MYTYLATFCSSDNTARCFFDLDHLITVDDINKKEEELLAKYGRKFLINHLTLLPSQQEKGSPVSETEYAKYIVKNLDSKEEFPFDFRSEATEFFDDLVREHGDTMELELSVRIRHHVPPEISPLRVGFN